MNNNILSGFIIALVIIFVFQFFLLPLCSSCSSTENFFQMGGATTQCGDPVQLTQYLISTGKFGTQVSIDSKKPMTSNGQQCTFNIQYFNTKSNKWRYHEVTVPFPIPSLISTPPNPTQGILPINTSQLPNTSQSSQSTNTSSSCNLQQITQYLINQGTYGTQVNVDPTKPITTDGTNCNLTIQYYKGNSWISQNVVVNIAAANSPISAYALPPTTSVPTPLPPSPASPVPSTGMISTPNTSFTK